MCCSSGVPDRPRAIQLHMETLIKLGIIESVVDFLVYRPDNIPFSDVADECMSHVEAMNPDCGLDVRIYVSNIIQREGAFGTREVAIVLYDESDRLSEFGNSLIPLMNTIEHLVV